MNSGPADIGVLVVYTSSAASAVGNINTLIETAAIETNDSYSNSNIYTNVYIAHSAQVNYNETNRSYLQHVEALESTSDGIMDNIHSLRDQYLADVVVLIVNDWAACGWASVPSLAGVSTAFAAVHFDCATGNFSFGHEIGHLMGARHDIAMDPNDEPFPYGHGYLDPNDQWRTIMGYPNACNGCLRIHYWFNPNVSHPTTGQAMGTVASENNARVLNETRYSIRDFKTLPVPRSLTFANPYSYGENPRLTWSDVPEADQYNVYRCITENNQYSPSCFQKAFGGPVLKNGSTWEWSDLQVTIDQYRAPCDKRAIYRVTAQNITGEAIALSEPRVCIDTMYGANSK